MSENSIKPVSPSMVAPQTITENSGEGFQLHLNQQTINVFGHVQGFDQLEKLSPEVRAAALQYLEREQGARLQYLATEQRNQYALAEKAQGKGFEIQAKSIVVCSGVFLSSLIFVAYMAMHGQTTTGIAVLLGEVAAAAILVAYGEIRRSKTRHQEKPDEEDS